MEITQQAKIIAELAILHEISSFDLLDSEESIGRNAIEKASRLFGIRYFAWLREEEEGHRVVASWGFRTPADVYAKITGDGLNQFRFSFSKFGRLFMEHSRPLSDRERRLYTIFARQMEKSLMYAENVAERANTDERIRESEARYRSIFENADDMICLLNTDGTYRSLNPAFERITGWKPEEWIGKPFAPIVHPDDLPYARDIFRKLLAGESSPSFALRLARKSEVYFDADLCMTPLGNDGVTGALGIARDITERKQMEDKIRKLNEELEIRVAEKTHQLLAAQEDLVRKEKLSILGQLSGSVGHELRNPLGVMSNAVYFLKMVLPDADESVQEYLDIIKNEIDNSLRIITDLLDFARTKTPRTKTVTARKLLDESLVKCVIPENVELQTELADNLPLLRIDPLQMIQVLQNLIMNAVQAMPDGGALRISARCARGLGTGDQGSGEIPLSDPRSPIPDPGFVEISVADSGEGITPENMKHLFQPLFTTKPKGIGLGLVVCKNLVEANGGRIVVVSEPGQGTTFSLLLPVEREEG